MEEIPSLQCQHCDYIAVTSVSLRVHNTRKHPTSVNKAYHARKDYICSKCDKSFRNNYDLNRHGDKCQSNKKTTAPTDISDLECDITASSTNKRFKSEESKEEEENEEEEKKNSDFSLLFKSFQMNESIEMSSFNCDQSMTQSAFNCDQSIINHNEASEGIDQQQTAQIKGFIIKEQQPSSFAIPLKRTQENIKSTLNKQQIATMIATKFIDTIKSLSIDELDLVNKFGKHQLKLKQKADHEAKYHYMYCKTASCKYSNDPLKCEPPSTLHMPSIEDLRKRDRKAVLNMLSSYRPFPLETIQGLNLGSNFKGLIKQLGPLQELDSIRQLVQQMQAITKNQDQTQNQNKQAWQTLPLKDRQLNQFTQQEQASLKQYFNKYVEEKDSQFLWRQFYNYQTIVPQKILPAPANRKFKGKLSKILGCEDKLHPDNVPIAVSTRTLAYIATKDGPASFVFEDDQPQIPLFMNQQINKYEEKRFYDDMYDIEQGIFGLSQMEDQVVCDVIYHSKCDKQSIKCLKQDLIKINDNDFFCNFIALFTKMTDKSKNDRRAIFQYIFEDKILDINHNRQIDLSKYVNQDDLQTFTQKELTFTFPLLDERKLEYTSLSYKQLSIKQKNHLSSINRRTKLDLQFRYNNILDFINVSEDIYDASSKIFAIIKQIQNNQAFTCFDLMMKFINTRLHSSLAEDDIQTSRKTLKSLLEDLELYINPFSTIICTTYQQIPQFYENDDILRRIEILKSLDFKSKVFVNILPVLNLPSDYFIQKLQEEVMLIQNSNLDITEVVFPNYIFKEQRYYWSWQQTLLANRKKLFKKGRADKMGPIIWGDKQRFKPVVLVPYPKQSIASKICNILDRTPSLQNDQDLSDINANIDISNTMVDINANIDISNTLVDINANIDISNTLVDIATNIVIEQSKQDEDVTPISIVLAPTIIQEVKVETTVSKNIVPSVSQHALDSLLPGQQVNADIINTLASLQNNYYVSNYIMNTYFYTIIKSGVEQKFNQIKRGLQRKQISSFTNFNKILIPINMGITKCDSAHWYLIVIDLSLKQIQIMDSLLAFKNKYEESYSDCVAHIGAFFKFAFNIDMLDWQVIEVQVPQQINGYDCGVYVCKNIDQVNLGETPYYDTDAKQSIIYRQLLSNQVRQQQLNIQDNPTAADTTQVSSYNMDQFIKESQQNQMKQDLVLQEQAQLRQKQEQDKLRLQQLKDELTNKGKSLKQTIINNDVFTNFKLGPLGYKGEAKVISEKIKKNKK